MVVPLPLQDKIMNILQGAREVLRVAWHLGFTSFGGPPVHFKIFHDKFVTKLGWVDDQIYQEIFSVCQSFSGPGSTKMLYCLFLLHMGFASALFAFVIWSLPGAVGMYGLSVGVSHIGENLPAAAYALLTGLNASVVGVIALAGVQLAQKAITDKMTRLVVFFGAAAGLLYNALWYFPLLIFVAGVAILVYDFRLLHPPVLWVVRLFQKRAEIPVEEAATATVQLVFTRPVPDTANKSTRQVTTLNNQNMDNSTLARIVPAERDLGRNWKQGTILIALFFVSFIIIMVLRGTLSPPPFLFKVFANFYLAGTIIFGGGPVVVPLLRDYIVAEGWVSPRDFLLGLAIIQAFPGPNFNFAVYLGSLSASNAGYPGIVGAIIGFVGIMAPGIWTVHGEMGLWSTLRGQRWLKSMLRGINAAAVGIIFTAVYRLWQIGYIDSEFQGGTSLGRDPFWLVVAATAYTGGQWFGFAPFFAIVLGAVMGLVRYGIVGQ